MCVGGVGSDFTVEVTVNLHELIVHVKNVFYNMLGGLLSENLCSLTFLFHTHIIEYSGGELFPPNYIVHPLVDKNHIMRKKRATRDQ